ncbi:hypothetical protein QBC34DRAFT_401576 [Podospora aff. communis PSN243]|uniref:Actin-like ATPase domain-containing protein n=1 Tax=Podospora aff. communis PSN243 TaxID=3040156 RepID=A0AAV9GRI5_9PEZI|nr:hypothetical protein QBC34DRAFT_401576 [Podospora aff. communis PSN243]
MPTRTRTHPFIMPVKIPVVVANKTSRGEERIRLVPATTNFKSAPLYPTPSLIEEIVVGVNLGDSQTVVAFGFISENGPSEYVVGDLPGASLYGREVIRNSICYNRRTGCAINWGRHLEAERLAARSPHWLEPDTTLCDRLGLSLRRHLGQPIYSDPSHPLANVLVPEGLDIPTVCADFLLNIRHAVQSHLYQKLGETLFEPPRPRVHYVFSVIDPWNPEISSKFDDIVRDAGFTTGLRPRLISEAQAVLTAAFNEGHLKPPIVTGSEDYCSDIFLVVKCGEASVEISALEVSMCTPLQFRPCIETAWQAYGPAMFYPAFDKILLRKMKELKLPNGTAHDERIRHQAVLEFEKRICDAALDDPQDWEFDLSTVNDERELDTINGALRFSKEEMISACFSPVVKGILTLIGNQVKEVKKGHRSVSQVLLFGSFSRNDYLFQQVCDFVHNMLDPSRDRVIRLENPISAVARGLAKYGLQNRTEAPTIWTYYAMHLQPFIKGYHPEDSLTTLLHGEAWCRTGTTKLITTGSTPVGSAVSTWVSVALDHWTDDLPQTFVVIFRCLGVYLPPVIPDVKSCLGVIRLSSHQRVHGVYANLPDKRPDKPWEHRRLWVSGCMVVSTVEADGVSIRATSEGFVAEPDVVRIRDHQF